MAEPASLAGIALFDEEKRRSGDAGRYAGREMSAKISQHKKTVLRATSASIVPAMSQSTAKDTWTRDDADNEPIVEPDPANSRLATALLLNVPRPAKPSA